MRKTQIINCGLRMMILFIYLNPVLFISVHKYDSHDQYIDRSIPYSVKAVVNFLWRSLTFVSMPAWPIALRIGEPYLTELVYYPLLGAIVWFGYGCLLGWGKQTKRFKSVILGVGMCWTLMLFLGWAFI